MAHPTVHNNIKKVSGATTTGASRYQGTELIGKNKPAKQYNELVPKQVTKGKKK